MLCLLGLVLVSVIAYFVYSNYKKSTNCCKETDASGYCGANPNFMDKPGSDNVPSQTCLPCPSKCTLQQCETDSLQENSDTDSYFKDCVYKCMPSIRLCDMLENAACGRNDQNETPSPAANHQQTLLEMHTPTRAVPRLAHHHGHVPSPNHTIC